MAKHRTHSIEFKRQVVQEFLGVRRTRSPNATAGAPIYLGRREKRKSRLQELTLRSR